MSPVLQPPGKPPLRNIGHFVVISEVTIMYSFNALNHIVGGETQLVKLLNADIFAG